MMLSAILFPTVFAFVPLAVDKDSHSITFTARATDVAANSIVEFAFVGPDSDRAYEAMFVTDADMRDIAKAIDDAGIPRGNPVGQNACRFWPAGKSVSLKPSIWDFIQDGGNTNGLPMIYTGGTRDGLDLPVASTNMPAAFFALYSLDQSLLLLDESSDQSASYGRFTSTGKCKAGERYSFTVSWDGFSGTESRTLLLEPANIRGAIESLKGAKSALDVCPVFSPRLTASEAKAAAAALSVIDSREVRFNGFSKGQFFYRGFLPDEQWRDRSKRLTQPLEVTINPTNVVYTIIDEDWSVEELDPKLTPHDESLVAVCQKFKGDTCLFYVPAGIKLELVFSQVKMLPANIRNWYVFVD